MHARMHFCLGGACKQPNCVAPHDSTVSMQQAVLYHCAACPDSNWLHALKHMQVHMDIMSCSVQAGRRLARHTACILRAHFVPFQPPQCLRYFAQTLPVSCCS